MIYLQCQSFPASLYTSFSNSVRKYAHRESRPRPCQEHHIHGLFSQSPLLSGPSFRVKQDKMLGFLLREWWVMLPKQVLLFQACYLANPSQGFTIGKSTESLETCHGCCHNAEPGTGSWNSGERLWGCHRYNLRTPNHNFNMQRQDKQPKHWTPSREQDSMDHLPWYKTREYKNSWTTDKLTDIKGIRQDIPSIILDEGLPHYGPANGAGSSPTQHQLLPWFKTQHWARGALVWANTASFYTATCETGHQTKWLITVDKKVWDNFTSRRSKFDCWWFKEVE